VQCVFSSLKDKTKLSQTGEKLLYRKQCRIKVARGCSI